jgi:hypothetical protein
MTSSSFIFKVSRETSDVPLDSFIIRDPPRSVASQTIPSSVAPITPPINHIRSTPLTLLCRQYPSFIIVPPSSSTMHAVRSSVANTLPAVTARRPRPENEITPSPFRPPVPANQRILMWTTPHSVDMQVALNSELSTSLQRQIFEKILAAFVHETLQSYGAGLLRFTQFCDRHGISERCRMPASAILLSAFIAEYAGSLSGKAIENWLNGLRLWHLFNRAEWFGKDEWLTMLRRTAAKEGVIFRKKPRGPITLEHLRALRRVLDLSLPLHAAIWATATAAFWGCRRLGELLIKTLASFDPVRHVSRATSMTHSIVEDHAVISLLLPWTKSTSICGGQGILTSTGGEFCPVIAFLNHLRVNYFQGQDLSQIPLFAYRDGAGWKSLTKDSFLSFSSSLFLLGYHGFCSLNLPQMSTLRQSWRMFSVTVIALGVPCVYFSMGLPQRSS